MEIAFLCRNLSPPTNRIDSEGALLRRLLRGGSAAFLGKALTYPLGLVLTMFFTRLMSTSDVGGYFLAISLAMLASGLVQAGLATTMCKLIARSLGNDNPLGVRKVLKVGILSFVAGGVLAIVLVDGQLGIWLVQQLDDGEPLIDALPWIALMIVAFAAVNYCCEILRGFSKLPSAALLDQQLLQRVLLLVILILPLSMGEQVTLTEVLRWTAFAAIAAATTGMLFIYRSLASIGRYGESLATLDILREAPAFLVVRVNNWILNSAAIWVLGFARPLDETAMYGAANVVALLTLAAWQVVSAAVSPTVVTMYAQSSKAALQSVLGSSAAIATIPGALLAMILVIWGADLLQILFTSAYADAYQVLIILAIGRSLSTFFGSPIMLLSMTNYQNVVRNVLFLASALTLVAYFLVAERYGASGVALVTACSAVLQGLTFFVIARQLVSLSSLPRFARTAWREIFRMLTQR